MTLTKEKPKRPTTVHRKRYGNHHRHSHHYVQTYWPYLPIAGVLVVGLLANSWLGRVHQSVLGYATDMSIQELLDGTNAQRSTNGEATLALNAELDSAAQAKANDMAARDYWSHNAPDGQTPWTFITAAGYDYQTAGENLAYGFDTSADTITAWMNSPEHRANILNTSFKDVGFGIINIANYQSSGPETLVVAMYGAPASPAVAAATPPPAAVHTQPAPNPAPAPSPAPSTASSPLTTTKAANTLPTQATPSDTVTPTQPNEQRISRFQLVASDTPMNSFALILFGLAATLFILLRHGLAWRKVLTRGEAFVLHHPLLDVSAATVISLSIILSHTVGLIR
jgi:hypothetical protein